MKAASRLVLCLLSASGPLWPSKAFLPVSASSTTTSWKRVWSDEFDLEALDTDKWAVLEENVCAFDLGCDWNRRRLDQASEENAYIDAHGHLVIVAQMAEETSSLDYQTKDDGAISSARLSTFGSADFLHGLVEVRAKVAPGGWGGWSGVWLLPSEEQGLPRASCAGVSIMETAKDDMDSVSASLSFGDEDLGCQSSDDWPQQGGGCVYSSPGGVGLSDGFHVYSLEWDENEFRWYVDGSHFCTKHIWSSSGRDTIYQMPFNKAFHLELGLALGGGENDGAPAPTGALNVSALPQEMMVDYVRISQGPSGSWWTPPLEFSAALSREGMISPTLIGFLLDVLAVAACMLGPYMAMTGLSRPRTNTILLGMETGAFKAANAFFFISGSYAVALAMAVVVGLLTGCLAVRHRPVARWNTVAGLTVPVLFVLIDVGMISDMGSRYVCWAIFFVLTITFTVLAFPSEHHAMAFRVATAATGGCVLKLGLGRLLGVPGEIFKILDDPLGDRCHVLRTCRSLTWVSGAVFFIGVLVQWYIATKVENLSSSTGVAGHDGRRKARKALFTPPRSGPSSSTRITRGTSPKRRRESQEPRPGMSRRGEGRNSGGSQNSKVHAAERGVPNDRQAGIRRPKPVDSANTRPDSPTPVPMPPTGTRSNTVVSSLGDTIELVVHSPTKVPLQQYGGHPSGWTGHEVEAGAENPAERRQRRQETYSPNSASGAPPSREDDDALSVLSLSELLSCEPSPSPALHLTAALLEGRQDNVSQNGGGKQANGRLADAFSERWGSWLGSASSDNNDDTTERRHRRQLRDVEDGGDTGEVAGSVGRRAREFDHEALLLSPYDPHPTAMATAAAREIRDVPLLSPCSSTSSTQAADDGDWTDNRMCVNYNAAVSMASTAVTWKEATSPDGADASQPLVERRPLGEACTTVEKGGHGDGSREQTAQPATTRLRSKSLFER